MMISISGLPKQNIDPPAPVGALVDGEPTRCVWENELGGLTFEVGHDPGRWFVKWVPADSGLDLAAEADRLRWAAPFRPVPRVLAYGGESHGSWLSTAALCGESAVSYRWQSRPRTAVRALGAGLRAFHDALPVDTCPYSWTASHRLDQARRRVAAGLVDSDDWHLDFRAVGVQPALAELADIPPTDRMVVCHGDACAPNTLIGPDGACSGHVDLGHLGIGDRWSDLAIATWSTEWNYGPGWQDELLDAYGVEPDPVRTRYYRLLWEMGV